MGCKYSIIYYLLFYTRHCFIRALLILLNTKTLCDDILSGLKAAFDEKTLFPKTMLDYEAKMKSYHSKALENTQVILLLLSNSSLNGANYNIFLRCEIIFVNV